MKTQRLLYAILLILFTTLTHATLYEDSEDGNIDGWDIYSNSSGEATISNFMDDEWGSKVICLHGAGKSDGYRLRLSNGDNWNDTNNYGITWSMKYSEDFTVYISVETTNGRRYFAYRPINETTGLVGSYINIGLGFIVKDGLWERHRHNLVAELGKYEPNNTLLSINGFLIRGTGYVDEIATFNPKRITVYEDAEDKNIDGWGIYSDSSGEAIISNIMDSQRKSRVIKLQGQGKSDGYNLRLANGEKWQNRRDKMIKWSMKYSEDFTIYVSVETTYGRRYLTYRPEGSSGLSGSYINIPIGLDSNNGTWQTVNRDLQGDIHRFEQNNRLLSVNEFLIRGSGLLDDIALITDDAFFHPSVVGHYDGSPSESITLSSSNNTLLKNQDGVLEIVDVTDSSNPVLVGEYSDGDLLHYFRFSNDDSKVFAMGYQGLSIIDVSDRSNPFLIGSYSMSGGSSFTISEDEKKLFISVSGESELKTIDISDPSNPVLVEDYNIPAIAYYRVLSSDKNRAFIAEGGSLKIMDISDIEHPILIGLYRGRNIRQMSISNDDNKLFISDDEGFKVIDVSNPSNIFLYAQYNIEHLISFAVSSDGNKVYISADIQSELLILDMYRAI